MRTRKEIDQEYQMECMKAGDLLNKKNLLARNLKHATEELEKTEAKMKALCEELSSPEPVAAAPQPEESPKVDVTDAPAEECKKED